MAVKIKSVERPQAGTAGGGIKKFYASPVHNGEISGNALIEAVKNVSGSLTGANICAMLYAMEKAVITGLKEGKIVRLGDLGSFRVTINSEGKDTAEEITANAVKKAGIIFTPGKRTQEMLNNIEFIKL